jgi:hypothetical protein
VANNQFQLVHGGCKNLAKALIQGPLRSEWPRKQRLQFVQCAVQLVEQTWNPAIVIDVGGPIGGSGRFQRLAGHLELFFGALADKFNRHCDQILLPRRTNRIWNRLSSRRHG